MGFGHRVYKNYDPRAKIIKTMVDKVLTKRKINDPLINIARRIEELALADSYFIDRKLYPNVDFYSGIMLRALGPTNMFTVIFAMVGCRGGSRMAGTAWLIMAYRRPRQIYIGNNEMPLVPLERASIFQRNVDYSTIPARR